MSAKKIPRAAARSRLVPTNTIGDPDVSRAITDQSIAIQRLEDRFVATQAPATGRGFDSDPVTVNVFTSSSSGVVPGSGGGTANFLRADGSWSPPGGGSTVSSVNSGSSKVSVSPTTGAVVVDVVPANLTGIPESGVTNLVTDLASKALSSRLINTTSPLQGGGDLSADRTLSIASNGISNSLIRQGTATSVIGNSTGSLANVADIVATVDSVVLTRQSGLLAWTDISQIIATIANRGHYGDGSDGAIDFDGTTTITLGNNVQTIVPSSGVYTLPRDIFPTTMIIRSGVVVRGAGFFIFCSVSANGPGTYSCDGGTGGTGTSAGGTAGTAPFSSARYNNTGLAGGAGSTTVAAATGVSNSGAPNPQRSGGGGTANGGSGTIMNGGGGGGNGGTGTGGSGGANAPLGANSGGFKYYEAIVQGRSGGNTSFTLSGCSGGGGGGVAGAGGGGGGGGGGYVGLFAPIILGAITIQANGGNGGAGNGGGNTGGGGGGGGGYAILDTQSGASNVTINVNGGTGGTKNGTGIAGGNGFTGTIVRF